MAQVNIVWTIGALITGVAAVGTFVLSVATYVRARRTCSCGAPLVRQSVE